MKRLLKAVVVSLIVGLFAVNLVGCGESENESDKELKGLLKEKLQNDINAKKEAEDFAKKNKQIEDDFYNKSLCSTLEFDTREFAIQNAKKEIEKRNVDCTKYKD